MDWKPSLKQGLIGLQTHDTRHLCLTDEETTVNYTSLKSRNWIFVSWMDCSEWLVG